MKLAIAVLIAGCFYAQSTQTFADAQVSFERLDAGTGFAFENIESPATNDAGTNASWKLVEGERDRNGANLGALHDGRVPAGEDEPRENFFFRAGSEGGRILADLGKIIPIKRISSYSSHRGDRAAQVYTVYGSKGDGPAFIPEPRRDQKPEEHGWQRIAAVDTRTPDGMPRGQYGVSITDSDGSVGHFRYLLFDVQPTEKRDRFGQTFYSEIDIVAADGPELKYIPSANPSTVVSFSTEDGQYRFQLDLTEAADLKDWSETELIPVVKKWYPKIIEMLPSEGYHPASKVILRYRNDMPGNIPASAAGAKINLNTTWFRNHLKDQAKGSVVHELVHVVQDYAQVRRTNPKAVAPPAWFVEGLADYIRWFLYEPQTGGARLSRKQLAEARHDASYRTSANFIDWVVRTQDQDIAQKLNAAAREGKYDDSLWEIYTRKRLSDLADEWRQGE